MRPRAVLLLLVLLLVPATAGCVKDVRAGVTNMLFYIEASEAGVLDRFSTVNLVLTHASFKPNETGVQPEFVAISRSVDLVAVQEGGPLKLFEKKIPYRSYDKVSVGVNVTGALDTNNAPTSISVIPGNIYETQGRPFRTRLAGDVAYFFVMTVIENRGEYVLQLRSEESRAESAR